jgi:hypothetical protein
MVLMVLRALLVQLGLQVLRVVQERVVQTVHQGRAEPLV